ncbi:MAG: hypothetical protein HY316_03635 [Acidobacteria bacterium]|nr:hypothetical protein [Acidobacteriota bacterium]
MAAQQHGEWNAVLLGASTLLGKELKTVLAERKLPLCRLLLVDAEVLNGQLTDFDGEPVIVQPVGVETFQGMHLAIFASTPSLTREHWRKAQESGCRIIDLSYCLAEDAQARLGAPLVERILERAQAGNGYQSNSGAITVSAHPVAMALAGILRLLSRQSTVLRAAATVFEPASERGNPGVEELHRQTLGLLSFQEIPKTVFDAQVSFNLLPRNGEDSRPALQEVQERIGNHLRRLLGGSGVQPALRLLQAPVFHGYSFTCWVELAQPLEPSAMEGALGQEPFSVCRAGEQQPNPVSAASSDDILLGAIERDSVNEAGYWIWGAFDNLRIAALNAERIAEEMMGLSSVAGAAQSGGDPVHLSVQPTVAPPVGS